MENAIVILLSVLAVFMLLVIALYNHLDRLRFRLDRNLHHARKDLAEWVALCAELKPGCDSDWRKAKHNWQKTACLQALVLEMKDLNSPEKLDAQEALLEFCYLYSDMARRYNARLESPLLGRAARLLGFRPYTPLDFYPDVKLPGSENE